MSLSRSMKHTLNKLIDGKVHPKGHPKDLGTILVDECLHALVEGEFRPDKFVRYTLAPMLFPKKPRRRRRR